ncbi:MAG: tRNA uridine-5-carboxymethylaminomethyl(34) synthesis GTPase MnmE [Chitinophagaceae bacterium]
MPIQNSTIIAIATPPGVGAIGLIRLSGPDAITIIQKIFSKKNLENQASHTLHFGRIIAPENAEVAREIVDEVVLSLFRNPHSYTGEDVVELSCHGAPYILQRIVELCVDLGAVPAKAGEFTQRAFLNGKLDLTQAEAVGDLIAAESKAAQQAAMNQLRGGFSKELNEMREELINFSALMELELDFSQEDVEFADRTQLNILLNKIESTTVRLIDSFRLGNAVKNGVSVAIIGAPNAGKSTLLNALLNEERAIVSEIAGTTRDTIEEVLNIEGILFRFIDTAGIREHTDDSIEQQGIARSRKKASEADVVIELLDASNLNEHSRIDDTDFKEKKILLINKIDLLADKEILEKKYPDALFIAAKNNEGIDQLHSRLLFMVMSSKVQPGDTIITNTRHLAALQKIAVAIAEVKLGLAQDIPGDLIALDIRQALHYIGELTGQVLHDRDVLGAVFGKFCIGK